MYRACIDLSGLLCYCQDTFLGCVFLFHLLKDTSLFWDSCCLRASSTLYPNATIFLPFPLALNLLLQLPMPVFPALHICLHSGKDSSQSKCCIKSFLAPRCVFVPFPCCACTVSQPHINKCGQVNCHMVMFHCWH